MTTPSVYEVLAHSFIRERTDTCFALLGDANMYWASALSARGCEMIYVRDEHCAVAAAMSYSRMTQRVGVATVTCGPGLTQILTALPAAVRANIPLVIFAGEAPLKSAWYNQAIEQRPFIEACGAEYISLHHPDRMLVQVRDAFLKARQEQRPVVIGVPFDLQEQPFATEVTYPEISDQLIESEQRFPNLKRLRHIAGLIRNAQKIIVMAGRGAVLANAGGACADLAAKTNALLATTLPARGLFRNDPYCIGIAGGFSSDTARRCLMEDDLIIAVGTRLAHHNSDGGKLFDAANVVHIDNRPRAISQGRAAARIQLAADAKLGVEALTKELSASDNKSISNPWRSASIAMEIKTAPADAHHFALDDELLDPRAVVAKLDEVLPEEWSVVNSSGHCSYFFAQMPRRPVDHFVTIREFGAIGNGIAFAMGAAAARPEQPVVLFDGDGSLLMHIQELETIMRHRFKILICVLNDGAYGSEIHKLRAEGISDSGAVFGRSNFSSISNGFGLDGVTFNSLDSLEATLENFKSSDRSCVWDFHVSDKVVSPVVRRSHG